MPSRKRALRPVQIFLTEDDLAAIIAETTRGARPPPPTTGAWTPAPAGEAAPPGGAGAYPSIGESVWRSPRSAPGAVGEAIRRILEATSLEEE